MKSRFRIDAEQVKERVLRLRRMDKILLVLTLFLCATGFFFIYGTGQEVGGEFAGYWRRHLRWLGLGGLCYLALCLTDYRFLARWSWVLYILGLVLLASAFTPLGRVINGARSWVRIPGLQFQPSELTKPATLLFASWIASLDVVKRPRLPLFLPVGACVLPPMLLVMLQPDFGTALVFIPLSLGILFVGGVSWRWIAIVATVGVLAAPLTYSRLRPHQKDRIHVFLQAPSQIALGMSASTLPPAWHERCALLHSRFFRNSKQNIGKNWNAHQSLLAVGSGGMWGKGFMHGTQHVLGFLPRTVAPTDFIFSVVAEETGFVGSGTLVLAFAGFLVCCLRSARLASDELGRLICIGVTMVFFTHIFINMGMTMQLAPIIGIP
ncbi:MAG: rod shape-determining protein RodA, partial [Lentisphaeria bacterium]|nr:rod shape-determining protein RodA [Lentisphaeria bacterium]